MKKFYKNKYELLIVLICLCMSGLHCYQFVDSSFQIYPLIRVIGFFVVGLFMLITGLKSLPYTMFIFALALAQTISFENYTPFIVVLVCSYCLTKFKYPMYFLYFIDVIIVCVRHDKSAIHLIIHICNCLILYGLITLFVSHIKSKIDVTPDEEEILNEIVFNGKKLKEIDGLKQNTVSKKLKTCREKNNCSSNQELYSKYKKSKSIK